MGTEIERKFLVIDDSWRKNSVGVFYRQGYLAVGPPVAVRVRVAGAKALLNIKKATLDIARAEFEYAIPAEDAESMLAELCEGSLIEKTRYKIPFAGHLWEVDEFHGENAGLIVAEIELTRADESFERPPWVGNEVSNDPRYLNACLARRPFSRWSKEG